MSDSNGKKSKFQEATDNARARERGELVPASQAPTELDVATLPAGMVVESATVREVLAARIRSGEWEQAPQLLTLKLGQTLIGVLESNGPDAEFVDEATGVVTHVKTWIVSNAGVRVSILSSVQLDKKLPPFMGGEVSITRGQDIRNGTSLYTDYLVMGPKRADGKARDWSARPMLAAPANTNANHEDLT